MFPIRAIILRRTKYDTFIVQTRYDLLAGDTGISKQKEFEFYVYALSFAKQLADFFDVPLETELFKNE